MRKVSLIIAFLAFVLVSFGQTKGRVQSITVDTVKGNETVNFNTAKITGDYSSITFQALLTQVGGTTDGTITLYGSLDGTSYSFINFVNIEMGTASPKASITGNDLNQLTMTDALVGSWVLRKNPYNYYRLAAAGTANDTTQVTVKYLVK